MRKIRTLKFWYRFVADGSIKNKDGLPESISRGSLSTAIPVRLISSANEAVRDT